MLRTIGKNLLTSLRTFQGLAECVPRLILTDIVDDSLQDQQRVNDDIHLMAELTKVEDGREKKI